ncbi:MAG: putative transport system permease protein [Actinomycetota bacterium]|jgi:putative ABC transport system permease protein|nr:putative transport system permease protein [Actinomycetota bacterium]
MNLENIRIAIGGIVANRMRSALTTLGILIGVGAVILVVAVGNGSAIAVQKNIQGLGTNTLIVSTGGFGAGRNRTGTQSQQVGLTAADVTALQNAANAPDVKAVSPVVNAQSVTGTYQGSTYSPAAFTGVLPVYEEIRNYPTTLGRFISADDQSNGSKVVVLGSTVVTNLFGSPTINPVGEQVQFGSQTFTVIGVLKTKGTNGTQNQDDIAMIPLSTMQQTFTGVATPYNQLAVEATSASTTTAAQAEILSTLAADHHLSTTTSFNVLNQASLLATSTSTTQTFTVLLGAVAAISLLVGGIGVMNIMLVTVTERTREIGIRQAIGARTFDIMSQFLVEAVLLTLIGGLTGVAAGLIGSHFKIVGIQPAVTPVSVVLAFCVALAVGLFFGIYPANRAASLRPIDALRYE